MTYAEYAKLPGINWSTLKEVRRSPKHYRHLLENPREDSTMLALGRAVHTAVLERDRFPLEYVVFPGKRRAGKEWDAFEEANAERTIVKADEYTNVLAMRDAVLRHGGAVSYLTGGVPEHTVTWTEKVNGIDLPCKARPDYIGGAIADLKSTRDAGPIAFGRTAARFGYHCQLAWYRRGVRVAMGRELAMKLIAVETDAPHDVAVYNVSDDALWAADDEINQLLVQVASCRASDKWPGANEEETDLQLPAWVFADGDDEELTSEVIEED